MNPANFECARHFAAWLGLTPRERSTGGKHRLGRISKADKNRLREHLVVGALLAAREALKGAEPALSAHSSKCAIFWPNILNLLYLLSCAKFAPLRRRL